MPVVAAPMAGGPTTPELVVAAAAAGSRGFVPAGYRSAAQLADDIATVRAGTESFGVNLFVPEPAPADQAAVAAYRELLLPEAERLGIELGTPRWDDDDWEDKVDLLVAEPVPWVSFTFGAPEPAVVHRLRAAGSRVLVTVTSAAEADRAAAAGTDGLVVQAAGAGGHRGTFDAAAVPGTEPLPELVRAIRAAVALPVVAAGGIAGPEDVRAAQEAGAEAVQVGTALLLADEAATRPVHRTALAEGRETVVVRAFTGRLARGLRNRFADTYDAAAPAAYPQVHHLTAPLRRWAAEHGDAERVHLWAGAGHAAARPGPVGELLTALVP